VLQEATRQKIKISRSRGLEGGGSDHLEFARVGIPSIFFFADDLSKIHTPEDTMKFVNQRLLGDAATLALYFIDYLAQREKVQAFAPLVSPPYNLP
jgi:Zn-dependent M28 family amino/carboxypeptidase